MTRAQRQRGVALLLAVAVVAVLTLTVFPFLYEGRVERAVATNLYTSLQARHLAEGGVVIAEALLRDDAIKDGQVQGGAYDGLDETWARFNNVPIAAGGGAAAMVIVDEQGKLNLNRLVSGNTVNQPRRDQLARLLTLLEVDPVIVDALVDWLDANDDPIGFQGAESAYYLTLTPPYKPTGPLATVAELGLVKGWTPDVVKKVSPFVTIYGTGAVNPNTAPREVLVGIGLDEAQADRAIAGREKTAFRNIDEFRQVSSYTGDANLVTFRTNAFGVTVTGSFRDSVSIVRTVLLRGSQFERRYWRVE